MNHEMFELSDEQLEMVAGGDYGYNGYGANINIAIPVNIAIAPTLNINVLSKLNNVSQSGADIDQINAILQQIH